MMISGSRSRNLRRTSARRSVPNCSCAGLKRVVPGIVNEDWAVARGEQLDLVAVFLKYRGDESREPLGRYIFRKGLVDVLECRTARVSIVESRATAEIVVSNLSTTESVTFLCFR
jgi:hypothetical protein